MSRKIYFVGAVLVLMLALFGGTVLAAGDGDPDKGKTLWAANNCKSCHGANGEGKYAGDGKTAEDWIKQARTPKANMPAYDAVHVSDMDLTDMWALAEERGTRFLLVYIPSKEHVYWSRIWDPTDVNNILERSVTVKLSEGDHGHFVWDPMYLSYGEFNQNHNAQEKLLTDFARDNQIEFLNLTPTFWEQGIKRGESYQ